MQVGRETLGCVHRVKVLFRAQGVAGDQPAGSQMKRGPDADHMTPQQGPWGHKDRLIDMKGKKAQALQTLFSTIQANDRPPYPSSKEYAVVLHTIEQDLKALTEKVEAMRYALLRQASDPHDLFAVLAAQSPQFLRVEELGEVLQVDRRTVYGLRRQGLPSHRVGKELRFDPLEVAAWLKQRQQPP